MNPSITFNVAGVTFNTGDKSRQDMLRKIYFHDAPFDGNVSFTFERYEYEGELAIAIYANGEQIGNVPRDDIMQFNLLWVGDYDISTSIYGGNDKSWGCELTVSFSQPPMKVRKPRAENFSKSKSDYMRCPICGNRLRRSVKNPEYGLCDICAKKIPWVDEDEYEFYTPSHKKTHRKVKRNVCAIISLLLTLAYLTYSAYYWGNLSSISPNSAEQLGSAIAVTLVFPHLIASVIAFIFNAIGVILPNRWFVLVGAILYAVAIILFFTYFMFVFIQMILSFIGFALMKPVLE